MEQPKKNKIKIKINVPLTLDYITENITTPGCSRPEQSSQDNHLFSPCQSLTVKISREEVNLGNGIAAGITL